MVEFDIETVRRRGSGESLAARVGEGVTVVSNGLI